MFLSLISVLFLSLLCTIMESSRIQGARAKASAALDMGMFSLFGEFENSVLEQYDVFFLDGACGTGRYSGDKLEEKLKDYMEYNVSPGKEVLFGGYDPFKLSLKSSKITKTAFATDEKGNAFYQQAVGFMYHNLATEVLNRWMERKEEADELKNAEEIYKDRENNINKELKTLEEEKKALEEEKKTLEEQKKILEEQKELPAVTEQTEVRIPEKKNPLEVIKKIKKKGLMGLVLGNKEGQISNKKIPSEIPSKRPNRKGNLSVEKTYSGVSADFLFEQYLFERFSLYTDKKKEKEGYLEYDLEYILCGKNTDEKNLKSVINRLLLMREGANFLFLTSNLTRKGEADALAALLTGAIPIPGIQAVTSYALLLVWAYAESLLDLRCLFAGGKIPVIKTEEQWRLDLSSIPDILELLEETGKEEYSDSTGLDYEGYLQILFTLGSTGKYPMRALDLVEGYVRKNTENKSFRTDQAIVKAGFEAEYQIPSIFLNVTNAFMKTGTAVCQYQISGSFSY